MKLDNREDSLRADISVLAAFALLIVLIHFLLGNGYGFHRDELQFLDDARHLQWGFVAYPPLTSFCGRIAIALFGISPQALRLPAALVNALSLVLVGLIARELGGRRPAQLLALVAAFPLALVFSSVLQYNTFDMLAWCVVVLFTARVLRGGDEQRQTQIPFGNDNKESKDNSRFPSGMTTRNGMTTKKGMTPERNERNWLGVGVGVGLGVLSKYSIAFLVASLVAGVLLLPSQRHHLRSKWFWFGALIAAVIAAPNLIWLASHHFITLRMEHHIHMRDVRIGRADGYYSDQIKFMMFAFPLAVLGLIMLVRSSRFRLLSVLYIGPFVLFALAKGRGYYLMPADPVLYAAGAVALEGWLQRRRQRVRVGIRATVVCALLLDVAAFGWACLPMWRVGSAGWNWQMKNNDDMANEVGWPEFVQQVAGVRDTLPPEDRGRLAVLANNFGEAGALELYGPQYGLPVPISSTNSFHARGFGPYEPETVIVVGSNLEDQIENFESCSVAAHVQLPYGVRNEETDYHPEILVCRHLRKPWAEAWSKSQEFG